MILTGDSIISAISTAIVAKIGIGTRIRAIYKNTPMQNAKTPYIFLNSVLTNIRPRMKHYYQLDYTVDVIGRPEEACTTIETWARDLSLDLTECLNYITVGDYKCKCTNYKITIVDNVLHIVCNYSTRAYLDEQEVLVYMRTLEEHYHEKK